MAAAAATRCLWLLCPVNLKGSSSSCSPLPRTTFRIRCNLSGSANTITEPKAIYTSVKTFAPATVANLGPGFDFLGCAVDGLGDTVSLRVDPQVHPGEICISEISGQNPNKLSKNRSEEH